MDIVTNKKVHSQTIRTNHRQLAVEQDAQHVIKTLDLCPIINQLVHHEGWSRKHAQKAAQQYRNYLLLFVKYGKYTPLPPSDDINHVWNAHILQTHAYMTFSYAVFKRYLHHYAHHPRSNDAAQITKQNLFRRNTQRLYYQEYGTYIKPVRSSLSRVLSPFKKLVRAYIRELTEDMESGTNVARHIW